MAKIKQEINPKCAERLKELCKRFNTTQTAISEKAYISQNTLSKIAQGKAPMTYTVASAIASVFPSAGAFPSVSVEWLMGTDDYMNYVEEGVCLISSVAGAATDRSKAIRTLIRLAGYEVGNIDDTPNSSKEKKIESVRYYLEHGIPIRKNGQIITHIPVEKFRLIELDIQELAELRIKSYLREVEEIG